LAKRVKHAKFSDIVQPDTRPLRIKSGHKAGMAHCRVSDRIPKSVLTIAAAEMIYHELDPSLDDAMIQEVDAPLYERDTMANVYAHLRRTFKDDDLRYEPPDSDSKVVVMPHTVPDDIVGIANSKRILEEITLVGDRAILNQVLARPPHPRSAPVSTYSDDVKSKVVSYYHLA
jgi:hypothetical protein